MKTSLACRITMSFEQTYFVLGALEGQGSEDLTKSSCFLDKSAAPVRYDRHLRTCYPITSRVTEGACRHVV